MRFRKKPVVIEATQWFKNGDHPNDESVMLTPDPNSTSQFEPFLSEGKVVRYYRHPGVPGTHPCGYCDKIMHFHGWIDTLEGGHVVCPGDWIITGVNGERYPCKPDIFDKTYETEPAVEEYKTACVSTAHITKDDIEALNDIADSEQFSLVAARPTGWFVKLFEERNLLEDYFDTVSPDLLNIIHHFHDLGYRMLEIDGDADVYKEFPVHEWSHI